MSTRYSKENEGNDEVIYEHDSITGTKKIAVMKDRFFGPEVTGVRDGYDVEVEAGPGPLKFTINGVSGYFNGEDFVYDEGEDDGGEDGNDVIDKVVSKYMNVYSNLYGKPFDSDKLERKIREEIKIYCSIYYGEDGPTQSPEHYRDYINDFLAKFRNKEIKKYGFSKEINETIKHLGINQEGLDELMGENGYKIEVTHQNGVLVDKKYIKNEESEQPAQKSNDLTKKIVKGVALVGLAALIAAALSGKKD